MTCIVKENKKKKHHLKVLFKEMQFVAFLGREGGGMRVEMADLL